MTSFNRENLKNAITSSVIRMYKAQITDRDPYRNTLDCFSASLDALLQGICMDDWLKKEKERQVQKTKQNAIGSLHEDIMCSIDGVDRLSGKGLSGRVLVDIVCKKRKIIAEVKNKYNTTKGSHKVQIYRDLSEKIEELNNGYTGYYVEVLPKGAKSYNQPFTPSDNQTSKNLPTRDDIRIIDGKSFYSLLTGNENALEELYRGLPLIVSEIIKEKFSIELDPEQITDSDLFNVNYTRAYGDNDE